MLHKRSQENSAGKKYQSLRTQKSDNQGKEVTNFSVITEKQSRKTKCLSCILIDNCGFKQSYRFDFEGSSILVKGDVTATAFS